VGRVVSYTGDEAADKAIEGIFNDLGGTLDSLDDICKKYNITGYDLRSFMRHNREMMIEYGRAVELRRHLAADRMIEEVKHLLFEAKNFGINMSGKHNTAIIQEAKVRTDKAKLALDNLRWLASGRDMPKERYVPEKTKEEKRVDAVTVEDIEALLE